jgi:aspartate/methionine/tyrosine aminotransferase
MDLSKLLAERVKQVPLGRQTSVAIPGMINMGSGTPDFVPPDFIFDAMREAVDEKQIQYTPWAGTPRLRQAAATKLARENGLTMDPDLEIMVTSGAQEATTP